MQEKLRRVAWQGPTSVILIRRKPLLCVSSLQSFSSVITIILKSSEQVFIWILQISERHSVHNSLINPNKSCQKLHLGTSPHVNTCFVSRKMNYSILSFSWGNIYHFAPNVWLFCLYFVWFLLNKKIWHSDHLHY